MPGVRSARWAGAGHPDDVDAEPVLYRDEAIGLVLAVHDILEEVRNIRDLLDEDDGEEEVPEDLE